MGHHLKNILGALALGAATTVGAQTAAQIRAFVQSAKANLAEEMKDPSSVQFRKMFITKRRGDGKWMLCGEFNAKNGYGAYVGFQRFISSAGSMVYYGEQIDAIWDDHCSGIIGVPP